MYRWALFPLLGSSFELWQPAQAGGKGDTDTEKKKAQTRHTQTRHTNIYPPPPFLARSCAPVDPPVVKALKSSPPRPFLFSPGDRESILGGRVFPSWRVERFFFSSFAFLSPAGVRESGRNTDRERPSMSPPPPLPSTAFKHARGTWDDD